MLLSAQDGDSRLGQPLGRSIGEVGSAHAISQSTCSLGCRVGDWRSADAALSVLLGPR